MHNLPSLLKTFLFIGALSICFNLLIAQNDSINTAKVDQPKEEVKIPPRGQTGQVTITTNPSKATIYLGGTELGLSPIENLSFPSGRHDLTIILKGEELINERVNVWHNELTSINRKLVLPYGTIILTTKPGYARVYIDAEEVGRLTGGPLTINNVEAGTHILKVTRKGRKKEKEVIIIGEDTTKIHIKF